MSSAYCISDYESIRDLISSKHSSDGELAKSSTLPRCHPFKVPEVPVRKSSVDGKLTQFLCLCACVCISQYVLLFYRLLVQVTGVI